MNLRIPKGGAVALVVVAAISCALFIYLMGRFGGPALRFTGQYRVTASLPDSKQLAVRSDVDVRGVKVGQVERIVLRRASADVTFSVQSRYAPIYRDATVQVGEKTLLGEAYLNLDRGHASTGTYRNGANLPPASVLPASIEIDQALNALTPPARQHLKATLETMSAGVRAPSSPARVSDTLAQLHAATSELLRLTDLLHGQESDIAQGVQAARVVLSQFGQRESAVRTIVSGGHATLAALAARDTALKAGIAELPLLLSTAQVTLRDARPLLEDARPLLADLRTAAPPLTGALIELPPASQAAVPAIAGLDQFTRTAVPVLGLARTVLGLADPVSLALPPALRNLVTMVRFLSARRDAVASWFSNTGDLGSSRDSKGFFARFFIFIESGTAFGFPGNFQNNAYTQPGDAAHNRPYSGYPRLYAYEPPPPKARQGR
jgi:phospholipid/cholesterol/gamma-HCH transport system substrate-binding protein